MINFDHTTNNVGVYDEGKLAIALISRESDCGGHMLIVNFSLPLIASTINCDSDKLKLSINKVDGSLGQDTSRGLRTWTDT